MQNSSDGFLGGLKRELLRAVLEKVQGMQMQNAINAAEDLEVDSEAKYEVEEILNNPYMNRSEVPLAMDIFKPVVPDKTELPVIVTIHGGGLVIGDRKMSRRFAKTLAGRGYLVFSVEYRLAPRANSAEQLDDVCAGMDLVGRKLVDYDVDFTRMFLVAESAGAYLAIYVAAMKGSIPLQKAIGYEPTKMRFSALGLISGMFYTNLNDPIGLLLSEQFFGDKMMDKEFLKYMNPEHKEIVDNLPPAFFITSRGDFLNNYTLMYHKKLKKTGKPTKLIYYGEDDLGHAFVTMEPWTEQSQDAINKMIGWFEEQATGKSAPKKAPAKKAAPKKTAAKSTTTKKTTATKQPASSKRTTAAKKTAAKKPAAPPKTDSNTENVTNNTTADKAVTS